MMKKTSEELSHAEKQQRMKGFFMKKTSKTDWKKVASLSEDEIDTSDAPEWNTSMFASAKIQLPENKKIISIRLPNDLIDWYKAQGKGYQTRMVAVLQMYKDARINESKK